MYKKHLVWVWMPCLSFVTVFYSNLWEYNKNHTFLDILDNSEWQKVQNCSPVQSFYSAQMFQAKRPSSVWGNYPRVCNNLLPLVWPDNGQRTPVCGHTSTASLLIVCSTVTGQGLNPRAAQEAEKRLLLQLPKAIIWCFMRIIHPGLVQGWGVLVFHIVESPVFSAHIMKWGCHPAMRPVCSQRQTWRTCWKERAEDSEATSFMNQRRKTSWVQEVQEVNFMKLCCKSVQHSLLHKAK